MAYRVVVDKPQRVRALASSTNIVVADAQLAKPQVSITQPAYAATASSQVVNAITAYSAPITEINYQNLSAIDMALDPYSLNKYFRLDQVGVSEAQTLLVIKAFNDLVRMADQPDLQVSKGLADSFGMGDNAVVLLEILREFADSAPVIDAQTLSLGLIKAEALGIVDIASMFISKAESEVANISEQAVVDISNLFADSVSTLDQFTRAVVYQRSFSDVFVLDDFTDVDAIQKATIATKTNVIGFSDIQSFVTEKTLQDTASLTELAALSTERAASDSVSVGDVFQKVTTFSRAISDSTPLSDSSSAAIGKELSDTATLSEAFQKDLTYNRTLTDAVSFAEQSVAAFDKGLSDVASITESIQITTSSLASSVLNASALNSVPLNN